MTSCTSIRLIWLLPHIFQTNQVTALRLQYQSNSESEIEPEFPTVNTAEAIENVKRGTGSVWLFHTTHNAGTSLKDLFQGEGLSPSNQDPSCSIDETDLEINPKTLYYDNVCGEYGITQKIGDFGKKFSRNSNKLVAVYPIRHPILRIMSGDGDGTWEEYPDGCFTDNYGLRKVLGLDIDVSITQDHIEAAKARAASFDIIADMTKFSEGMETICQSFYWTCENANPDLDIQHENKMDKIKRDHPEIYQRWLKRNAPEIEFYEFARALGQAKLANLQESRKTMFVNNPTTPKEPIVLHEEEDQAQWICGPLPR